MPHVKEGKVTLRRRGYLMEEMDKFYVFGTVIVDPKRVVAAFRAYGLEAWPVTKGDKEFRPGKKTVKVLGEPDKIDDIATQMSVSQNISFRAYKRDLAKEFEL